MLGGAAAAIWSGEVGGNWQELPAPDGTMPFLIVPGRIIRPKTNGGDLKYPGRIIRPTSGAEISGPFFTILSSMNLSLPWSRPKLYFCKFYIMHNYNLKFIQLFRSHLSTYGIEWL